MEERIKLIMADILNVDENSIDESTSMAIVDSWDSLNHINLCVSFEQEFQVTFDVAEIESMVSYGDVLDVLRRKLETAI